MEDASFQHGNVIMKMIVEMDQMKKIVNILHVLMESLLVQIIDAYLNHKNVMEWMIARINIHLMRVRTCAQKSPANRLIWNARIRRFVSNHSGCVMEMMIVVIILMKMSFIVQRELVHLIVSGIYNCSLYELIGETVIVLSSEMHCYWVFLFNWDFFKDIQTLDAFYSFTIKISYQSNQNLQNRSCLIRWPGNYKTY